MSHEAEVKQCRLRKGEVEHYAWVPVKFANKGYVLDLKNAAGWSGPWTVEEVYQFVQEGPYVRSHQKADLPSLGSVR